MPLSQQLFWARSALPLGGEELAQFSKGVAGRLGTFCWQTNLLLHMGITLGVSIVARKDKLAVNAEWCLLVATVEVKLEIGDTSKR